MTGRERPERPKRHTSEIIEAIWEADLPPVMDDRDERAAAVAEPVARLVLMAMARFTNPNRDQVYGPTREWRCWASVATIAEMAGASERQVQRVLRVFERAQYIERVDQGRRPGRPRKGQEPGQARPSTWCLRPDKWEQRTLRNRTGVVAISSGQRNSLPVPEEVPSRPVGLRGNQTGTGREGVEIVPVSSPEPGTPGTLNTGEQKNKPALAAARANVANRTDHSSIDDLTTDEWRTSGFQIALPGQAAVGITGVKASRAAAASGADALEAGKRIWEAARHKLLRPGVGLDPALVARARNTGTAGYNEAEGVLMLEGDLVAEDLQAGAPVVEAVAAAADGRRLELCLVDGAPPSLSSTHSELAPPEPPVESQTEDAEAVYARLREKLSAEDLARLDELERQRLAHAEQAMVVPATTDQMEDAETETSRPDSGRARKGVDEAPRRRRKKEPAVA